MQSGEGLTVALLLLGNLLGGLLLLLCHRYGSLPRMPGHATHDQSLGHSIVGIDRRFKLVLFTRSFVCAGCPSSTQPSQGRVVDDEKENCQEKF